jgi:hypothetical protein
LIEEIVVHRAQFGTCVPDCSVTLNEFKIRGGCHDANNQPQKEFLQKRALSN